MDNKKKININSTEPINKIADVERVCDAFEKRGGYITLEEDMSIRKRISSRNHLAVWISYVKNKLVYRKEKIVSHIAEARDSIKGKIASKKVSSSINKPFSKVKKNVKVALKRSLVIGSYSDICKEDPTLRNYQKKAKKEIFESWNDVDNVMFQMPTGTGKTRLFTSIIKDINDYSVSRREPVKILIIAHRKELIKQIGKDLKRYRVPNNLMDDVSERDYRLPVVVASIQTITHKKNLKDAEKLNVRFVIIDEAHHALAATYKKLWDMYPGAKKLGVTATPWRMNHQSFTDLFDKLVLSMPIKDFIKQGYLAPYKYFSLRSDSDILNTIDDIELDKFGEYKESSMEEKMDIGKIRAQLLQSYLALAEGKKGIIYAINTVHAKHICKEYQEAGYSTVCIDCKTPAAERDDLVEKFRRGKIDIIVNVDIFSEGFDCPDIEFIQLARPTRSLVKYLQQVGRGLRITDNKQDCIILDNVGMYSRFGLPDARRHWNYHFLGHDVDEEVPKKGQSKGTGRTRFVDMSEGTEDMELIQDDYKDIEPVEGFSSANNDFFPLFGITLGKTTWKQAKEMGLEVRRFKEEDSRNVNVEDVDFWDHEGVGIFTSLYWTCDESDFPPSWKSKGFDWNLSYDQWIEVFEKMGFDVNITRKPSIGFNPKQKILNAEFEALSPDMTLRFVMEFNYGVNGHLTSSPKTLYSITVNYEGALAEETEDIEVTETIESEETDNATFDFGKFFPLWGITLGKTTWKDAEDMGYEVDKDEEDRSTTVNGVTFWDVGGKGVFTSLRYRSPKSDFVDSWKAKGFSWDKSYVEWWNLFKQMGYVISVTKKPRVRNYRGSDIIDASFRALSPDGMLLFRLNFHVDSDESLNTTRKTLFSMGVYYKGSIEIVKIIEPEIESLLQEDISKLKRVFDNKATSYKFFWFMSILQLLHETEEAEIDFNKILIKMVANAWKYVFVEDGEFSLSDQLPLYLQSIKIRTHLKSKSSKEDVERVVAEQYDALGLGNILSPLLKNVPYGFLSPWIRFSGNNNVITKSQSQDINCLYELHDDCITIKDLWKDYFYEHYDEVMEDVESNLRQYLKI